MELKGSVAVVTGGASGIGRALCQRFAAEGARGIVVADLNEKGAEVVAAEVKGIAVGCDVGTEGQIVEIQPRIDHGKGESLAIEKKRFRGKIKFVDPQIQPVAEEALRIRAEFENPTGELRPGLMVQMTILSGAAAFIPSAVPKPQPSAPPCPIEK